MTDNKKTAKVVSGMRSESEIRTKIKELEIEYDNRDRSIDSHCQSKPLILLQSIKVLEWVLKENEEFTTLYLTEETE